MSKYEQLATALAASRKLEAERVEVADQLCVALMSTLGWPAGAWRRLATDEPSGPYDRVVGTNGDLTITPDGVLRWRLVVVIGGVELTFPMMLSGPASGPIDAWTFNDVDRVGPQKCVLVADELRNGGVPEALTKAVADGIETRLKARFGVPR